MQFFSIPSKMFLDPSNLPFFQDIIYLNILKPKQSFLLPKIA